MQALQCGQDRGLLQLCIRVAHISHVHQDILYGAWLGIGARSGNIKGCGHGVWPEDRSGQQTETAGIPYHTQAYKEGDLTPTEDRTEDRLQPLGS